jgi:hypothetical protein
MGEYHHINPSEKTARPFCPVCKKPLVHPGAVLSVRTLDDQHAVLKICRSCVIGEKRLPRITIQKRRHRAAEVALSDPARYGLEFFDSRLPADLVAGLLADQARK